MAIVGAGLAGLVCAAELSRCGISVTIFDKGRFPGGRLASRMRDENSFDYGAQYFTARDETFRQFLAGFVRKTVVARWNGEFAQMVDRTSKPYKVEHPRYVGVPMMRSFAEELARERDILLSHRVTEVLRGNERWTLSGMCDRGESTEPFSRDGFDSVVLNMPPPQAAALYPNPELLQCKLLPCCALLMSFNERLKVDFDGIKLDDPVISWVARDSSKPGRPQGERWVVHATAEWSQNHFETSSDEIERLLIERFATLLNLDLPEAAYSKTHKWRFALPASVRGQACILDREHSIAYCGDWCIAPRVEGAFLSGLAAASAIERCLGLESASFARRRQRNSSQN